MHNPKPKPIIDTKEKAKKPSPNSRQDFSHEYIDRKVKINLANGSVIEGVLLEASKYWLKIRGSTIIYVNKAWVISVEPL